MVIQMQNHQAKLPWPPGTSSQEQADCQAVLEKNQPAVSAFITAEKLPGQYGDVLENQLLPLAAWLRELRVGSLQTPVIGITGAQGSGKTTLSSALSLVLGFFGLRCCTLSIDDFYLSKSERQQLAHSVHPLLVTRGVPGTHDIAQLDRVIDGLVNATEQSKIVYPRFNKAVDDRYPESQQNEFVGQPDLILLEGWCVGALAESPECLNSPANSLESSEDTTGVWRRYVNDKLAGDYGAVFKKIDCQLFLAVANMEVVFKQRALQEQKLRESQGAEAYQSALSNNGQLRRFIMHYQRITQGLLRDMPETADFCFSIGDQHQIKASWINQKNVDETTSVPRKTRLLVFSDLDGTLLDHENYSFEAARPALERLQRQQIPLVLNSSKTAAELISIREALTNSHPFIVENGSALYIPVGYFNDDSAATMPSHGYEIVTFGADYGQIVKALQQLRDQFNYQFTGFNDLSVQQLAKNTGLTAEQSALAKQRAASEPLIWQDSEPRLQQFLAQLEQQQLSTLQGGRFLHVLGSTDKARPIHYLLQRYQKSRDGLDWQSIALGDSKNDAAMLLAADYAVLVKNPEAAPFPLDREQILRTEGIGPVGWNRAIETLLNSISER